MTPRAFPRALSAVRRPATPTPWLDDPAECGPRAGFGIYLNAGCDPPRGGNADGGRHDRGGRTGRWLEALRAEIRHQARRPPPGVVPDGRPPGWPTATSVFVGGGIPGPLPGGALPGLLGAVFQAFDVADDAEVTVEILPETADEPTLAKLAAAGVTRVSLTVGSLTPRGLAVLGRRRPPGTVATAVAAARQAGIATLDLDLVYGVPGESAGEWRRSLQAALDLGVDHISASALTDATRADRPVPAGRLASCDPDVHRRRFDAARRLLSGAGFDHYELCSWASSPTRHSRHTLCYWRHGNYLGMGVGAHSHRDGRRWWQHDRPGRWLAAVEAGRAPVTGSERLDPAQRATERLMLGLRMRDGLAADDVPPVDPDGLADAVRAGLVTVGDGRLRATDRGWYLLDDVVIRLL